MQIDKRQLAKINRQLFRYHSEELMEQIAALEDQIEENLESKQSIMHIRNMIDERQRYLNEYLDTASQKGTTTIRRLTSR